MQPRTSKDPTSARRTPREERAQQKIGIILEAAIRLIEASDIETVTTNAVAEEAGVSIGTLYQYFDGKQAILNALARREIEALSERVMEAMKRAPVRTLRERVHGLVNALLETYGGSTRVHRLVLEHALTRSAGTRLNPLYARIGEHLVGDGPHRPGEPVRPIPRAEAFVLTHAVAGVMRAMIATPSGDLNRDEAEAALTKLIAGFANRAPV